MNKQNVIVIVSASIFALLTVVGVVVGKNAYDAQAEKLVGAEAKVAANEAAENVRKFSIAGTWDPEKFSKVVIKESATDAVGSRDIEVLWPSNNGDPTPLQGKVFRPNKNEFAISVAGVKLYDDDTGLIFNLHGYGEVRDDGLFFKECDLSVISDSPIKKADKIGIHNQCKGLWAK